MHQFTLFLRRQWPKTEIPARSFSPMVVVRGLDRLDGSLLSGMPDALWSRHTAELRQRFENQEPPPLGFSAFCARFDTGELTTLAMREHMAAPSPPAAAAPDAPVPPPVAPAAPAARLPSRFPEHWGPPPLMQTRDLRPLPGGYGMGSGTLARWIAEKMAADAAAADGAGRVGASEPGPVPGSVDGLQGASGGGRFRDEAVDEAPLGMGSAVPSTSEPAREIWPDLVGAEAGAAAAAIRAERPELSVALVGVDSMVTMDHRLDRVRIWVRADGTVDSAPRVG